MSKHKREVDQHLIDALNNLPWPLINKDGKKVFVTPKNRNESGFEHISGKCHYLKVRDMELIPSILQKPINVFKDNRKGKIYIGKRKGVEKRPFLKIVVKEGKRDIEFITTIYTSKERK